MKPLRYAIISGSSRKNSQSRKVAEYIKKDLLMLAAQDSVDIFDLAEDRLPFWDDSVYVKELSWDPTWARMSQTLQKADGIIIIAAEWNGMMPPELNNFFQLAVNGELAHKAGLIVAISSGNGGTYPVFELRMCSFKNSKICYIPEHIVVRNVQDVLNEPSAIDEEDSYIRDRLRFALNILKLYTQQLQPIRDHADLKNAKFMFGM